MQFVGNKYAFTYSYGFTHEDSDSLSSQAYVYVPNALEWIRVN
jgi:hypothetical protein